MSNCEVKDKRYNRDRLEEYIRNSTEITKSQSVIDVTKEKEAENAVVLKTYRSYHSINELQSNGRWWSWMGQSSFRKQDLIVAHNSGSIQLTTVETNDWAGGER